MSIFRKLVWYVKGVREYTRAGYETAAKLFSPSDLDVDCSSKSFIVTGANSGLGYTCALEIARRHGTVHLVCRNEERGQEAKRSIEAETKNDKIHLHVVDLSQPKKIFQFVNSFASQNPAVDVLINNAGCMLQDRQKTSDGLDANFATNTLGSYVITQGLLKTLKKSKSPRVIFVSSGGMLLQKLDCSDLNFENMTNYDGVTAYSQNKRQQVVMCEEFGKNNPEIFFASMHPGWADTPGVRTAMPDFYEKMKSQWRSPGQGADTIVWLAVSQALENKASGEFYQYRAVVPKHLPLAWTKSSDEDQSIFMKKLDEIAKSLGIEIK